MAHALVARLAESAPVGAIWLTPSAAGDADLPREEVRPVRGTERVAHLQPGKGKRGRWTAPSGRDADLRGLDELYALRLTTVVLWGPPGVGKSRLMREVAVQRDGLYLELDHVVDPWTFLYVLGARLGVPLDEVAPLERAIAKVAVGVSSLEDGFLALDHVHDAIAPILQRVVVASDARWLISGIERLGVRGESSYQVGPIEVEWASPLETHDLHRALSEVVGGHPLASRVLATQVRDAVSALVWVDRLSSAPRDGSAVRIALPELLPRDAAAVLACLVDLPRSVPMGGIRAMAQQDGQPMDDASWEAAWSWLLESGLIELRRGKTGTSRAWVSSWVRDLRVPKPDRDANIRRWARWVVERVLPWLEEPGERSARVLELLDAEFELYDACLRGLLDVERVGAPDLALLAKLFQVRSYIAVELGPAAPLLEPLEQALTAVGRSFDVGPDVAIDLLYTRAWVSMHLTRWDAALADLDRARGLAQRSKRAEDLERILTLIGITHLRRGRLDEAEAALSASGSTGSRYQPRRDSALGAVFTAQGRFQEAEEAFTRATAFEASLDLAGRGRLAVRRALLARRQKRPDDAVRQYDRALEHWRRLGRHQEELFTRFRLGTVLQSIGHLGEAVDQYTASEQLAVRAGDDSRLAMVLVQRGLVLLERGRTRAAAAAFTSALSAARSASDRGAEGTATGFLALVWQFEGRTEEAHQAYRSALRNLETGGERRFGALFHACLAITEAEVGNIDEARILLDISALQLPDADEGMRTSMSLFDAIVEFAVARRAAADGDHERATEIAAGLTPLTETPEALDTVYARFARTYLKRQLAGGPPWTP